MGDRSNRIMCVAGVKVARRPADTLCVGLVLLILSASALPGAQPPPAMEASLQKQRVAIERQRQSVRKQGGAAAESAGDAFFTVPWTQDAAPAAAAPPPAAPADDASNDDCQPVTGARLDRLIQDAARREGLTPDLLRAVIDKESAFNACAVSPKGAMGLMQLMPSTAQTFGVKDAFDPKQNIDAGTRFLKQLLTRYGGDLSLALGAYNAGPGRVDPGGGLPQIPETIDYVADILDRLRD
jgi:soluble lytic murein transglycosylase-like protein